MRGSLSHKGLVVSAELVALTLAGGGVEDWRWNLAFCQERNAAKGVSTV